MVVGEQLDTVFDAMEGAGGAELFEGDGLGGVEAALVDPGLDAVEVDGGHVEGVAKERELGLKRRGNDAVGPYTFLKP